MCPHNGLAMLVFGSDDRPAIGMVVERLEECELRSEVSLSGLVKIEVIIREAREHGDLRIDLVGSMEFEGVRADLQDGMRVSRRDHLGELGLDDVGLWCGFPGLVPTPFPADMELDAVEQPGRVSRRGQHGVSQIGRCGLPVRTGDADDRQLVGRVIVERSRDLRERGPGVVNADDGDLGIRVGDRLPDLPAVCLDYECGCPVGDGGLEVIVAVDGEPGDGDEGRARRDRS